MSYTLSVFASLVSTYPTWASLEKYLTSDEGGKLRIINKNDPLVIIRYTAGVSNMDLLHVCSFRSVVWNTQTNRPVSVAPVKSTKRLLNSEVQVSEFLDGIMIQGFYGADGNLTTATRSVLGSTNKFYTDRTFAELLEDATVSVGGTNTFLQTLSPGSFVNLLLQHPEHKTVTALAQPRVYVTHVGKVNDDASVTILYEPSAWESAFRVFAPRVYETCVLSDTKTELDLLRTYNPSPTGHVWQGLVLQSTTTSERIRVRTRNYMKVRALRGFEAQMYERFLRLRNEHMTKEYLRYFPEDKKELWACENAFRNITQLLLNAYTQVFKLKANTFKDYHVSLRPHMYALHGKYIDSLKAGNVYPTTYSTVVDYMNTLALEEQKNLMRHLRNESPVTETNKFLREDEDEDDKTRKYDKD